MLIEHHPSHFNKGLILALSNTILWRDIRRRKRKEEGRRMGRGPLVADGRAGLRAKAAQGGRGAGAEPALQVEERAKPAC